MKIGIRTKLYAIGIIPVVLFVTLIFAIIIPEVSKVTDGITEDTLISKLTADISSGKLYLEKHFGELRLERGNLVDEQGNSIGTDHVMIDEISRDLGIVATIFKAENNDFRRVSTSITDDNGARVIGTMLGRNHAGYQQLSTGQRYVGVADLFGQSYFTAYEPIYHGSEVIGILFIGISRAEAALIADEGLLAIRNYVILAVLVVGIILLFVIIAITKPMIKNISDSTGYIVHYLAKGDFSVDVPAYALSLKDEFGDLARGLQTLQQSVKGMFETIGVSQTKVNASSQTIAASSQEMSASLEEVAASANEFASGAQTLSESAQKMSDSSLQVSENAQAGTIAINNAVNQMDQIFSKIQGLRDVIRDMDASTQDIGAIVNTIKGFSEQTNLLSLNAAIEAARAGESGRGFAVVADEVRLLAEQSTKSASEITELVNSIQKQSSKTVTDIEEGVEEVNKGKEIISSAEQTLKQIIDRIGNMKEQIDGVSNASQQIGAGSEEVSASVEEQSATMESIANGTEELSRLVEELSQELAKFRF